MGCTQEGLNFWMVEVSLDYFHCLTYILDDQSEIYLLAFQPY